ncbi:urea ABC transporter permease subunit UrtB [Cognatishimia sp. WU-CL00825]|uniref:urea ABC transporter permease subunit UrtB n=1 Tax=Cognatishimia sp. WU-CL00825 TaxID=3127658 RepID=UPI003108B570
MIRLLSFLLAMICLPAALHAQDIQSLLQDHQKVVMKSSRKTVGPVLDALVASGQPQVATFLQNWQSKNVYARKDDGLFFYGEKTGKTLSLFDISDQSTVAQDVDAKSLKQIKPNGGVRKEIGKALVAFQLSDPDIARRTDALNAISGSMNATQLAPLLDSIDGETDPTLKRRKERLANYLTARFGDTPAARIAAIDAMTRDLSVDGRAVLSQILETRLEVSKVKPVTVNLARQLELGTDLTRAQAYETLVELADLPALITENDIRLALENNVVGGRVGGAPTATLGSLQARAVAYDALAAAGTVPPRVTDTDIDTALATWGFYQVYIDADAQVTEAALKAQSTVTTRVQINQAADLGLDAISLASIYFLAAVGLAITFGVMGVINMAHGEFIMMGAYTGYVVQQFITNYTLSLVVALPLAFAVTFAAGVLMERTVIRWLYNRPLETLLATFGISIALQQLAKNIFGTQARPLTSPGWLDGAWVINDVVQISFIRIAIFVLALMFLGLLLFILKKTRLGLEVRAVTQNPRMAASMGINPDKIKMMTFGLGSGIAGIAGVAIGLFAKVTSEMGSDYIVQSFMTVVVGGVGNVWGTLAGAAMIGTFQKGVEWLNPSNTLAAQTYMILFIILFIQFRPKGIIALKGRAAGD